MPTSIKKISASLFLMVLATPAFAANPVCNATEFWVCTYTYGTNIKYETSGGSKADAYIKLVDFLGLQDKYQH